MQWLAEETKNLFMLYTAVVVLGQGPTYVGKYAPIRSDKAAAPHKCKQICKLIPKRLSR